MTSSSQIKLFSDLTRREVEFILKYLPSQGSIVEIGTGGGGTAAIFRRHSEGDIYTIDPYMQTGIADTLRSVKITPIPITSHAASKMANNNSVDFLYVDGGHDFKDVWGDIVSWLPKMKKYGLVVFDDFAPEKRGGLGNLGVTVCLEGLLYTGVLEKIDHFNKILVTKQLRPVESGDLDACIDYYQELDNNDNTDRSTVWRKAEETRERFWEIYRESTQPIKLRQYVETMRMLESVKDGFEPHSVEGLSDHIALTQSMLNLTRIMFEERKDYESNNGM